MRGENIPNVFKWKMRALRVRLVIFKFYRYNSIIAMDTSCEINNFHLLQLNTLHINFGTLF